MKRKIEDKILEELRSRVFKKDKDINERHDQESLKNATKEALTEMTEMSLTEINKIEKSVRQDFLIKQKKNRRRILVLVISAVIMSSFIYYYSGPYQLNNILVFEENFNDNSNRWDIFEDYSFNRYFKNGKYIFTSNREDSCYDDELVLKLPKRFTAEITTTWIGGQFDPYGPKFYLTYDGYSFFFRLHPKNKTNIRRSTSRNDNKEWIKHPEIIENGKHNHVQKISIKPKPWPGDPYVREADLRYYVNDKLIKKFIYDELKLVRDPNPADPELSLSVCGCQTVSFDHIQIRDDNTGKIIIDGPFENLKDRLHPKMEIKKFSYIENGEYIFKSNDEGQCYRTVLKKEFKKHSKINLRSTWLSGEEYYYGLILENDEDNYYAFELKSNGKACFIKQTDGKNEIFIDDLETGFSDNFSNDGNTTVDQTVLFKGNKIEYYVNDELVITQDNNKLKINAFGLRVCGRQTVAFDKLEIWE